MKLFLTCTPGLEELLADELRRFGASEVRPASRGVAVRGERLLLWRCCIESRIAERVLVPISDGPGQSPDAVYRTVMRIDWSRFIPRGRSFAVDATTHASQVNHRIFLAQKIKDGIVDRLRKDRGQRPNVNPKNPDVWIRARLFRDRLSLSWDATGRPLHQRGYRTEAGPAPLRETIASALLMHAGYDGSEVLVDPMCGAGTLVIEGAQIARRIPPGLAQAEAGRFAFQKMPDFDAAGFQKILHQLRKRILPEAPHAIFGADKDAGLIPIARRNAERAGVDGDIRWNAGPFQDRLPADEKTLLVANPPFGTRLSDQRGAEALIKALGDHLKTDFAGHRAALIVGNKRLLGAVGLRPEAKLALQFAKLDARIAHFNLYAGSRKDSDLR